MFGNDVYILFNFPHLELTLNKSAFQVVEPDELTLWHMTAETYKQTRGIYASAMESEHVKMLFLPQFSCTCDIRKGHTDTWWWNNKVEELVKHKNICQETVKWQNGQTWLE